MELAIQIDAGVWKPFCCEHLVSQAPAACLQAVRIHANDLRLASHGACPIKLHAYTDYGRVCAAPESLVRLVCICGLKREYWDARLTCSLNKGLEIRLDM